MVDQVIWSLEALDDVEEIAKFIERDSHFYAASVVTKILHTTKLLKAFPFRGVLFRKKEMKMSENILFLAIELYMKSEEISYMYLRLYMGKGYFTLNWGIG